MITELDKKIISLIQGDLPLDRKPFAVMAKKIGISEQKFIERVNALKEQGVIRRFGATLRHQQAGFSSNAMVAWLVLDGKADETGKRLARFKEVTHCYQRTPRKGWSYNLYTMIHGSNRDQCRQLVEQMSRATGIDEYELLFSEKEFKKISMKYF